MTIIDILFGFAILAAAIYLFYRTYIKKGGGCSACPKELSCQKSLIFKEMKSRKKS